MLNTRILFLVFVLVGANVAVSAADCPTCQTSFGAPHKLSVSGIDEVVSADFNGDSKPDLVALRNSTNEVLSFAGDGAGNFGTPISSAISSSLFRRSLVIADFNDDGKADLAITSFSTTVLILLGNGAGAFTLHATLAVASSADRVAVADFTNDGKQDLAVLSRGVCFGEGSISCKASTMTIFSGNATGDFVSTGSFPVGAGRSEIRAADFNNDGKIDLALLGRPLIGDSVPAPSSGAFVQVNFGEGNGDFGPSNFIRTSSISESPDLFTNLTIGDFNSDGTPDIAASRSGTIRIHVSDGQGGFTTVESPNYNFSSDNLTSLSVADFNGDGKQDLLQNQPHPFNDGSSITGYAPLGDGHGKVQLPAVIGDGVSGDFVTTGDFNNDGKPDLAVSNGDLVIMLNETDCSQPIVCVLEDVSVIEGNEGETPANVTLQLSFPSSNSVTVDFFTGFVNSGEPVALPGVDFKPQSGTMTFDPMVTTRTVTVPILGDTKFEKDAVFRVGLTSPVGAKLVRLPLFVRPPLVRILNDDPPPPYVSLSHATVFEGNNGSIQASVTVTLSAPQPIPTTLLYYTEDRSAQSSSDYEGIPAATPRELTFAAGETTRTITIPIVGDTVDEADEVFFVKVITNLQVLPLNRAVVTILNDDAPVNASAPELLTEEGSGNAIALDAVLQTAGPFPIFNNKYFGSDKQTRLSLFLRNVNLMPGEDQSIVTVTGRNNDPDSGLLPHSFVVEFIGPVAGTEELTQIIVKVPNTFNSVFDQIVVVSVRNVPSNKAALVFKESSF